MAWSDGQKYVAEFLGTFALLLFGGGAAVTSIYHGDVQNARVLVVSFSFGLVLVALAYIFGEVSGGHFNPAVTVSMWFSKRMPARDVLPYVVAQILGGLVGIGVVAGIVHGSSDAWSFAQSQSLGSQCYACGYPSFSLASVFLLEAALTFGFILVIQLVTRPENGAKNLAPLAIGLTLAVTNLIAIPIDGASLNPVRSFSPALLSWATWGATTPISQAWLFWVAPILGGVLAAVVETMMRPRP